MNLFPYQEIGAAWLARNLSPVAMLADEMGIGKTAQAIVGAIHLGYRNLIIGPAIARYNWQREYRYWGCGHDCQVLLKITDVPKPQGAVVCSFDYVREDFKAGKRLWSGERWDTVIIDEAHFLDTNEDEAAQRTRAALGSEGIIQRANRVWFLTGTPIRNHAGNLWLFASLAGITDLSYSSWTKRYCTGYIQGYEFRVTGTKTEMIPELSRLLRQSGKFLRRTRQEVKLQLPPVTYAELTVESPYLTDLDLMPAFPEFFVDPQTCDFRKGITRREDLERRIQREKLVLGEAMGQLENVSVTDVRELNRLARSVSTLIRYNGLAKVTPVSRLLHEELTANPRKKVVIFCHNKAVIEAFRERLSGFGAFCLYGKTKAEKRQKYVERFNAPDGKYRVCIGQITAAGTNISLVGAYDILIVQTPFVPGDLDQAIKRVDRIGQTMPVLARFVTLANDALDQSLIRYLKRKAEAIRGILDSAPTTAEEMM